MNGSAMDILDNIPFSLDWNNLLAQTRLEADSDDARDLRRLADLALRIGRPKAAHAVAFIEHRDEETLHVGGVTFRSRALCRQFEGVQRAFPMLETCGREMDEAAPAQGDPLWAYWWDLLKGMLLAAARRHLREHLRRRFLLGRTASMSPGSGDITLWPIEQQRELFALLGDLPRRIGVELTDSFLMIPNKTTSGLLFPAEKDFRSCEVCHRKDCPSRKAPFSAARWEEIEGREHP